MYDAITQFFRWLAPIVWGFPAWTILLGIGLILSIRLGFLQVSKFVHYWDRTLIDLLRKPENKKNKSSGEGDISPWQAINTAFCATMGVGTLAGTATAIGSGGPGAVFWMWIVAVFGITTKFSEVSLAVHFRGWNKKGEVLSGPFAYMERGVGSIAGKSFGKFLGVFFAVAGSVAAFGIGNMVQSNSAATAVGHQVSRILNTTRDIEAYGALTATSPEIIQIRLVVGIIAAILIGLVIIGGLKRIAVVVDKVIPSLAMTAIVASVIIILSRLTGTEDTPGIIGAFGLIFRGAFSSEALIGGVAGVAVMTAVRFGLMRGVFSNEAGLGSGPIAYAAARTDHPVKQGLWASFEVFLDTIIMCTLIALVILMTVPLDAIFPGWPATPAVLDTYGAVVSPATPLLNGAPLVITAFANSLFGATFGGWLMTVLIACFGFTTVIGWAFYGEKCFEYLFGLKPIMIYRVLMLPACVVGAIGGIDLIWAIADTLNAFMVLPNIISLLILSGVVKKLKDDYFKDPDNITYSFEKVQNM